MPEQSTTKRYLPPVKLEAATHNSGDIYIKTLGERYRGRWSRQKLGTNAPSLSRSMAMMPDVPGQQLTLIPKENKVIISDPLSDDPELLENISTVWSQASTGFSGKFKAIKSTEKVLDDDTFVTLLHEISGVVEGEHSFFNVLSGVFPTKEQIESLPGRELNELGSPFAHAKYKDEVDKHQMIAKIMAEKGIAI